MRQNPYMDYPLGNADLTHQDVDASGLSFLVDRIRPGELLVISFGFAIWTETPSFDFFGKTKRVESLTGRHINRVLLRDLANSWYHRGIPGLGLDVDETAESLKGLIRTIRPGRVVTIGQSMGGYAAIMFGALLNADQSIAFGPLSFLNSGEALKYNDRRWLSVMEDLERNPPGARYFDLVDLCRNAPTSGGIDVFFGTKPEPGGTTESVNLDAFHAQRLAQIPRCRLHPFPESGHLIVPYLSDAGLMDGFLIRLFFPGDS